MLNFVDHYLVMASIRVPPVRTGRPRQRRLQGEVKIQSFKCFPHLEGGRQIEEAPGEDDVVVGAEEEGDDDGANASTLQQGAQLA